MESSFTTFLEVTRNARIAEEQEAQRRAALRAEVAKVSGKVLRFLIQNNYSPELREAAIEEVLARVQDIPDSRMQEADK